MSKRCQIDVASVTDVKSYVTFGNVFGKVTRHTQVRGIEPTPMKKKEKHLLGGAVLFSFVRGLT